MKLSLATTILTGLVVISCLATSATAQTMVASDSMLPGPLANWRNEVESRFAQTLVTTSPDNKAVSIEVTRIEVGLDCDTPLKSYFKPGSFEVHSGSIPPVDLNLKLGDSRVSSKESSGNSTTGAASSCDSVRTSMPVMLAKLDDAGATALKQKLAGQAVISAPIATCYSGFPASIHDVSDRPFVVGVKPTTKGNNIAHQPIIQTIEDGYVLRVEPTVKDGSIELEAAIAYSTVSNLRTFQISGDEEDGIVIQIPEQTLKQVRLTTSLKDGETLFIDPRLRVETDRREEKKVPFGKAKVVSVEKQVYFLVTTRVVVQSEERVTSLSLVK